MDSETVKVTRCKSAVWELFQAVVFSSVANWFAGEYSRIGLLRLDLELRAMELVNFLDLALDYAFLGWILPGVGLVVAVVSLRWNFPPIWLFALAFVNKLFAASLVLAHILFWEAQRIRTL